MQNPGSMYLRWLPFLRMSQLTSEGQSSGLQEASASRAPRPPRSAGHAMLRALSSPEQNRHYLS